MVFPVAAVLIMLILGLLLRSVVAPWYLMASVGLGLRATLGATVLIFQHGSNSKGLMFMLPVIMYLFVVAIGTDYNILMIARLREEARAGRDAAGGRRGGAAARRSDGGGGRVHPGGDLRDPDALRQLAADRDGLRGRPSAS